MPSSAWNEPCKRLKNTLHRFVNCGRTYEGVRFDVLSLNWLGTDPELEQASVPRLLAFEENYRALNATLNHVTCCTNSCPHPASSI